MVFGILMNQQIAHTDSDDLIFHVVEMNTLPRHYYLDIKCIQRGNSISSSYHSNEKKITVTKLTVTYNSHLNLNLCSAITIPQNPLQSTNTHLPQIHHHFAFLLSVVTLVLQ